MATFPKLKTDAVMQYPGTRETRYASRVVRFLDGAEQGYREFPNALRRWSIRLDLLDETELAELENFFWTSAGAAGSFSFTDPWDETVYTNCSLEGDGLEMEFREEMRGATVLVVRENRN